MVDCRSEKRGWVTLKGEIRSEYSKLVYDKFGSVCTRVRHGWGKLILTVCIQKSNQVAVSADDIRLKYRRREDRAVMLFYDCLSQSKLSSSMTMK